MYTFCCYCLVKGANCDHLICLFGNKVTKAKVSLFYFYFSFKYVGTFQHQLLLILKYIDVSYLMTLASVIFWKVTLTFTSVTFWWDTYSLFSIVLEYFNTRLPFVEGKMKQRYIKRLVSYFYFLHTVYSIYFLPGFI